MRPKQRLLVSLMIAFGIGMFVLAGLGGAGDRNDITVTGNEAIDAIIPARESEILQRDRVGIDLADGFAAALVIEAGGVDVVIPSDQLDPNLQSVGRYTFKPGAGKALEVFPPQSNCVRATYWPLEDPDDIGEIRWCFEVL